MNSVARALRNACISARASVAGATWYLWIGRQQLTPSPHAGDSSLATAGLETSSPVAPLRTARDAAPSAQHSSSSQWNRASRSRLRVHLSGTVGRSFAGDLSLCTTSVSRTGPADPRRNALALAAGSCASRPSRLTSSQLGEDSDIFDGIELDREGREGGGQGDRRKSRDSSTGEGMGRSQLVGSRQRLATAVIEITQRPVETLPAVSFVLPNPPPTKKEAPTHLGNWCFSLLHLLRAAKARGRRARDREVA